VTTLQLRFVTTLAECAAFLAVSLVACYLIRLIAKRCES
jgi:hypothetical protein